jgi:pilus assembly protein Flp/PilA
MNDIIVFTHSSILVTIRRAIEQLRRDERGATMTEYLILVGVVALIGLAAFQTFGGDVARQVNAQATTVMGVNTTPGH